MPCAFVFRLKVYIIIMYSEIRVWQFITIDRVRVLNSVYQGYGEGILSYETEKYIIKVIKLDLGESYALFFV